MAAERRDEEGRDPGLGRRLGAQADRLRLLVRHLAGPALRARVEPDDLVGEVWLRVLARPEALPPCSAGDAALARWLATVARHVVVDAARAARAAKRAAREVPLAHGDWSRFGARASALAASGPGPATRAATSERAERLLRAFETLSAEHRRVLGLRQLEGLSAREAGRRMGRGEAAVHSLYRRALSAWEEAAARIPGIRDESTAGRRRDG